MSNPLLRQLHLTTLRMGHFETSHELFGSLLMDLIGFVVLAAKDFSTEQKVSVHENSFSINSVFSVFSTSFCHFKKRVDFMKKFICATDNC